MNINIPEDPFIIELLPEFVDTWIHDIDAQYSEYIEEKNDADLYRLAHTLKGSCYQFGLNDIGDMGVELMAITKAGEWNKAASYEKKLMDYFLDVKKYLEDNNITG